MIIKRYNKGGRIYFDDYVACCVRLRALTGTHTRSLNTLLSRCLMWTEREMCLLTLRSPVPGAETFKRRDTMQQGAVSFQYDDVSPVEIALHHKASVQMFQLTACCLLIEELNWTCIL